MNLLIGSLSTNPQSVSFEGTLPAGTGFLTILLAHEHLFTLVVLPDTHDNIMFNGSLKFTSFIIIVVATLVAFVLTINQKELSKYQERNPQLL